MEKRLAGKEEAGWDVLVRRKEHTEFEILEYHRR